MKKGCNFWAIFSNMFPLEDKVLQPPLGEKDSTKFPQYDSPKFLACFIAELGPICPQGIMFWAQIP